MTLPLEDAIRRNFEVDHVEGEEIVCRCKWHQDEGRANLYVNGSSGLYYCFVCGASGKVGELSRDDRFATLRQRLRALREPPPDPITPKPESWLDQFTEHRYWSKVRGFSDRTIALWRLGYDPYTNRLTIPIRTAHGELLGAIYRAMDESKPKYLHPKGFRTGHHLFGAHMVGDRTKVAVVEGPLDAIACWDARVPAVAVYGARLTEGQAFQLNYLGIRTIVPMFDRDVAGRSAEESLHRSPYTDSLIIRSGQWPWSYAKDPGELRAADRRSYWRSAGGT